MTQKSATKPLAAQTTTLPEWPEIDVILDSKAGVYGKNQVVFLQPKSEGKAKSANRGLVDAKRLAQFVYEHHSEIRDLISQYGIVVFRGFDVSSPLAFESVLLGLRPVDPFQGYLLQEPGRDLVAGTTHVFATNTMMKTGGGYKIDSFHSENSFSPDVPHLQAFWCRKASSVGGQTALVHSPSVYESLSPSIQRKLEALPVRTYQVELSAIAEQNSVTIETLREFCQEEGLEVGGVAPKDWLRIRKTPVFQHPVTGRKSLQVNLSNFGPAIDKIHRAELIAQCKGPEWLRHKIYWAFEPYWSVPFWAVVKPSFRLMRKLRGLPPLRSNAPSADPTFASRFGHDMTDDEAAELIRAVWQYTYLHEWQESDILLFDNIQTLHGGIPGLGEREIRVMLMDPLSLDPNPKSGLQQIELPKAGASTYWERLQAKRFPKQR